MSSSEPVPIGAAAFARATAAAAGSVVTTLALAHVTIATSGGIHGGSSVDDVVGLAAVGVATAAAAVLALGLVSLAVGTTARALGGSLRAADAVSRRLTPALLRRTVVAGLGVGLGLAPAISAHAAESDLLWVVTEQETTAEAATPMGAPGTAVGAPAPVGALPTAAAAPSTVEVLAGDSLWSIAAEHLGGHASEAEIAREWPRWYEANRDVVGGDPDMIRPGQVLVAPEAER